jgi:hypothetical protein
MGNRNDCLLSLDLIHGEIWLENIAQPWRSGDEIVRMLSLTVGKRAFNGQA